MCFLRRPRNTTKHLWCTAHARRTFAVHLRCSPVHVGACFDQECVSMSQCALACLSTFLHEFHVRPAHTVAQHTSSGLVTRCFCTTQPSGSRAANRLIQEAVSSQSCKCRRNQMFVDCDTSHFRLSQAKAHDKGTLFIHHAIRHKTSTNEKSTQ